MAVACAVFAACSSSEPQRTVLAQVGTEGDLGVAPTQPPPVFPGGDLSELDPIPTEVSNPSAVPTTPLEYDPRILMVGDSVMNAMEIGDPDAIDTYIRTLGWIVTVDAKNGRFLDQALDVVEERRDEAHDIVVLMLGNNYDGDADAFRRDTMTMLEVLHDAKRIIMFTVPLYQDNRQEVNDVLTELAVNDERLEIVNWRQIAENVDGVLGGDRLHPTPYGADVLAQLIVRRLGKGPFAGPDVTLPRLGQAERPEPVTDTTIES